jgi:hypothetical protein
LLKASSGLFLGRKLETRTIDRQKYDQKSGVGKAKNENEKLKLTRASTANGRSIFLFLLVKERELATTTRQGNGRISPEGY